jgi:SM-20-related protein
VELELSLDELRALGASESFARDGLLGAAQVGALREAAERLHASGTAFRAAGVGRGGEHRRDPSARSDETTWLAPDVPGFAPLFALFESLKGALNRGAYLGLERFDVQLARYDRGAHYTRHRDAFGGAAGRRVTAIFYLNPGWEPAQGGPLRVFLPGPVDVAPQADRLVVFLSERVEHEVLPAFGIRYAATAWFYGPGGPFEVTGR